MPGGIVSYPFHVLFRENCVDRSDCSTEIGIAWRQFHFEVDIQCEK